MRQDQDAHRGRRTSAFALARYKKSWDGHAGSSSAPLMTFSALRQLVGILSSALDALENELKPQGLEFPSLDAPYDPSAPAEAALTSDSAVKAVELIVAASSQLGAAARPPTMSMMEICWQFFLPAVLQLVNRLHVVELLRDAGPRGMHVRNIAAKGGVDELKLAHCLRLCATLHIFNEVTPDVFANNRLSSTLDSGKQYSDLVADPSSKYLGTDGLGAFLELETELMLGAAEKLPEHYTDPHTKLSREPTLTLMSTVHGYEGKNLFAFLEAPKNALLLQTFTLAMPATTLWETPSAIVEGYDWGSIAKGGLVVDVGGGVGNMMMPLYERFKELRFEVQDRVGTCEHGTKVWQAKFPGAISTGRMKFRPHDFFGEQPVKDASVFLLRNVTHNWPDKYLDKMLKRLRDSAGPSTRLLIADHVLPHTCAAPATHASIPGANLRPVPEPLLANLGRVNSNAYYLDICMLAATNARERTLDELLQVTSRSGWRILEVRRVKDDLRFGHVVAAPA
ncbi:O-methyltransferase [Auricularia subglabra TFB-10046 SS5]|nr:O-methyltransferase [Auricularia subglabra TFB-10046 SS5]